MKILLMGDASNYHATLAKALVAQGHDVTVASDSTRWMETARDIDIRRRSGRLGGALLWLRLNTVLARDLRGYDIVQLSSPLFLSLRPERNRVIFDRLRRDNGKVFLTALGRDEKFVRTCISQPSIFKYSEFRIGDKPAPFVINNPRYEKEWTAAAMADYDQWVYDHIDGVLTALYEYHLACRQYVHSSRLAYGGIPIDMDGMTKEQRILQGPLRIMLACHKGREAEKGVDLMRPVVEQFAMDHPDEVVFDFIQNVPFVQFSRLLDAADVVIDQLYSYTPATTALMAMARGKIVVSGGEPEYYQFIVEEQPERVPIINADPLDVSRLYADLEQILSKRQQWIDRAAYGPEFVAKHNSKELVAQRFINHWTKT